MGKSSIKKASSIKWDEWSGMAEKNRNHFLIGTVNEYEANGQSRSTAGGRCRRQVTRNWLMPSQDSSGGTKRPSDWKCTRHRHRSDGSSPIQLVATSFFLHLFCHYNHFDSLILRPSRNQRRKGLGFDDLSRSLIMMRRSSMLIFLIIIIIVMIHRDESQLIMTEY